MVFPSPVALAASGCRPPSRLAHAPLVDAVTASGHRYSPLVLVRRSLRREGNRTPAREPESVKETLVKKKPQVGMVEGVSRRI